MSFSGEVVMTHAEWNRSHPSSAGYAKLIGYSETCPGAMRRVDDMGTLECDDKSCAYRVAIRPAKPIRADQYTPDPDRERQPF